jgi:hypothetical protein
MQSWISPLYCKSFHLFRGIFFLPPYWWIVLPGGGSGGWLSPAQESEELELLKLELEDSEPPGGGSPPMPPAPSPLPSGEGVIPFPILIHPSTPTVYRRRNPLASGLVFPSLGSRTDLARECTDSFIRSFKSLVCRALVNSQNFLSKYFFVFCTAAYLSLLWSKSDRVFQAFPDRRICSAIAAHMPL